MPQVIQGCAFKNTSLRFGKDEIPSPPDHVPEKYKKAWQTLPGCCRNFFLNPGKGCCAGMPEPNAKLMETPKVPAIDYTGDSCTIPSSKDEQPPEKVNPQKNIIFRFFAGIMDWFKQAARILWDDIRALFSSPKK